MRVLLLVLFFAVGWAHDYPLASVQPGLLGHALTAVERNQIIALPLSIIAVQEGQIAGEPLILVRLSGEHIEQYGGIASGMSGSPVYITVHGQDQLLGAIAYAFANSDGMYGLVTPIRLMREGSASAQLGHTAALLMSGTSRSIAVLEDHFGPVAVAQVGTSQTSADAAPLEPGSAVALGLATGDVTIAAVGTVTTVENGELLMLGHPMFNLGDVDYSVQPVSITAVIPSNDLPFKIGNIHSEIIGSATRDYPGGVSGTLGMMPNHIPVRLNIHGSAGEHRFQFGVTNDERLTTPVLHASLLELFDRALPTITGGSATLEWSIYLTGYQDPITMHELAASPDDVSSIAARFGATPAALLALNEFRDFEIDRVELAVTFSRDVLLGRVAKIVAPVGDIAPGTTVDINLRFQPYRDEAVVRSIPVQIPDDASGEFHLVFRGGSVARPEHLDTEENPITRDFAPKSFGEYLTALSDHIASTEFIIEYQNLPGEWERLARMSLPFAVTSVDELTLTITESEDTE